MNFDTSRNNPNKLNPQQNQILSPYIETNILQSEIYSHHRQGGCCCRCGPGIIGNITFLIVMCIFNIVLCLSSTFSSMSSNKDYKALRELITGKSEENDYYSSFYESLHQYYDDETIHNMYLNYINNVNTQVTEQISKDKNLNYEKMWCDFGSFQKKILLAHLICLCIFLVFLIIEIVLYNIILKKEIYFGILRIIIILLNSIFYVVFKIFFIFLLYELIYEFFVIIFPPDYFKKGDSTYKDSEKKKSWKYNILACINILIQFFLIIFNALLGYISRTIIYLVEMYDITGEPTDKNKAEDDKIKTTSLLICGQNINIQVKANKVLQLKDIKNNELIEFKQIKLENITNYFIYIKMKNKGIKNMLCFTDFHYISKDPISDYLGIISNFLYGSLFISTLAIWFNVKDEDLYQDIKLYFKTEKPKKVKFQGIFKIYGGFENFITMSRFIISIITIVITLLFLFRRILFSGFSRKSLFVLSYALSIISLIIQLIYELLSFLLVVFSLFGILTLNDYFKGTAKTEQINMLYWKFYIQLVLSSTYSGEISKNISNLGKFCELLSDYKDDLEKLNSNQIEENDVQTQFQYTGLDSIRHNLNEFQVPGQPRYLYYTLNNSDIAVKNENMESENVLIINNYNQNSDNLKSLN